MQYRIAAVGRRARDPLIDAADVYLERLGRYVRAEFVLVRDADPAREARGLLAKTRSHDVAVVVDERGDALDTQGWAHALEEWQTRGRQRVVFLVGGADGHHRDVRVRADATWSLSRLTLPHRLAWVVLLEQLYRAQTLIRGEKYHRA